MSRSEVSSQHSTNIICLFLGFVHAQFTHQSILQDIGKVHVALHGKRIKPLGDGEKSILIYDKGFIRLFVDKHTRDTAKTSNTSAQKHSFLHLHLCYTICKTSRHIHRTSDNFCPLRKACRHLEAVVFLLRFLT